MENNTITLADLMNPALPAETAVLTDANGIFKVERTENGCCLHINSGENCTSYIMSAIAKYAENHADFDAKLVTLSESAQGECVVSDETEEVDRYEFDNQFSIIITDSGSKMIWNKTENKAFTFSFTTYDYFEEKTVNVMEMKHCMRLTDCVYAFCLEEQLETAKIGLVDVQTGMVVEPKFSKIFPYNRDCYDKFVGVIHRNDEWASFCCVLFCRIDTWGGLMIGEEISNEVDLMYSNGAYYSTYYDYVEFKMPDYDFFGDSEAPIDDNHSIVLQLASENRSDKPWIKSLTIDFRKMFYSEKEHIHIYFSDKEDGCSSLKWWQEGYTDNHYYLGEKEYDYVEPLCEIDKWGTMYFSQKDGRYSLLLNDWVLTGNDFTSKPYVIRDLDKKPYFVVEIYGKLGLLHWSEGKLNTILPIEFRSIEYHKKCTIRIKDENQDDRVINGGFIVKKMGMCAAFDVNGKQLTPFVREENFLLFEEYDFDDEWGANDNQADVKKTEDEQKTQGEKTGEDFGFDFNFDDEWGAQSKKTDENNDDGFSFDDWDATDIKL